MADPHESESDSDRTPEVAAAKLTNRGLGRSVSAGLAGENLSAQGVLDALGGVRGIVEALLPGLLYLVLFVFTQDARVSVIAPAAIALAALVVRIVARQPLVSALSGVLGIAVCVATTLMTGRGEDYFLPGFWINGAWSTALILSLLVGWPLLGFLVGAIRGDLLGWKKDRSIVVAARLATAVWLALFLLRLALQLPLYFAGEVAALGIARLTMGVPLFGLVILFTWLLFRHAFRAQEGSADT